MGRSRKRKTRSKEYNIDLVQVGKVVEAAKERALTDDEFQVLKTCENILGSC